MAPEILYLSDQATSADPVIAALEADGYEVVSTDSSNQAMALLFIMHSVAALVLHQERASFEVVRSLHSIHSDVPIVLLSDQQTGPVPSFVDGFVSTTQPPSEVVATVGRVLSSNPVV
jgi:DNA-binding response OmpR family regulator